MRVFGFNAISMPDENIVPELAFSLGFDDFAPRGTRDFSAGGRRIVDTLVRAEDSQNRVSAKTEPVDKAILRSDRPKQTDRAATIDWGGSARRARRAADDP